MKFIISEDRIYDLAMKHINSMFDVDNINWLYGTDDFGNEVDYGISFYLGDYDDDDNYKSNSHVSFEDGRLSLYEAAWVNCVVLEAKENIDSKNCQS